MVIFQWFPNIWHNFPFELISWKLWRYNVWHRCKLGWLANEYIWRCCRGRRKFLHSCGRFLCGKRRGKKASKVVDDSRGKFWWIAVGVSPELRIPASVASPTPLPHTALLATASQQSDLFSSFFLYLEGKVQKCGRSSIQGFSSLECCTMSKIMFWCTEKCTQPIFIADFGLITLHIANQICYIFALRKKRIVMLNRASNGQQCQTFWRRKNHFSPFPNPGTATPHFPAEIILMLCQILPEKSSYILKGRKLIIGIWGKTVASLGRVGGFIKAFMNAAQHRHRPLPSRSGCDFRPR